LPQNPGRRKIIQFGSLKKPKFSNIDRVCPHALKRISNILGKVYDPNKIKHNKYFYFIKHNLFITDLQVLLFPSDFSMFEINKMGKLKWYEIPSPFEGINLNASMKPDKDSELPSSDQKYYKYDKICDVLNNIVVTKTKSIPNKCFIRIRKWEVLIDGEKRKISDCFKPEIGHTYYLYYSQETGLRTWNNKCFKYFTLLDEGWFLDDIISGPYTKENKIYQLQKDTGITIRYDFITLLSTNNYVRQHTFFKPRKDGGVYSIKDNTPDSKDYIEPKIYFTIDYSGKKYENSFFSFAITRCEPPFHYKDVFLDHEYLLSNFKDLKELLEIKATVVRGGKNKRKVSRVNKKDVLGKQRNIYKFAGDKKEYIKYKNKYVLVKKYKEMQKTKSKTKTKSKSKK
jgi:hypothetical protein